MKKIFKIYVVILIGFLLSGATYLTVHGATGYTNLGSTSTTLSTTLRVSAAPSSCGGKVTLTWNTVKDSPTYNIYRYSNKSRKYEIIRSGIVGSPTGNNQFEDTPGTGSFYYKIAAVKSTGIEGASVSSIAVVASSACSTLKGTVSNPTIQTATSTTTGGTFTQSVPLGYVLSPKAVKSLTCGGKIDLSWQKATGAASYQIHRSTSARGTYSLITTTNSYTTYTDTPGQGTFYYKITPISSTGKTGTQTSYVYTKSSIECLNAQVENVSIYKSVDAKAVLTFDIRVVAGNTDVKFPKSGIRLISKSGKDGTVSIQSFTKNIIDKGNYYLIPAGQTGSIEVMSIWSTTDMPHGTSEILFIIPDTSSLALSLIHKIFFSLVQIPQNAASSVWNALLNLTLK